MYGFWCVCLLNSQAHTVIANNRYRAGSDSSCWEQGHIYTTEIDQRQCTGWEWGFSRLLLWVNRASCRTRYDAAIAPSCFIFLSEFWRRMRLKGKGLSSLLMEPYYFLQSLQSTKKLISRNSLVLSTVSWNIWKTNDSRISVCRTVW